MLVYAYLVDGQLRTTFNKEQAPEDAVVIEINTPSQVFDIIYDGSAIRLKDDQELKNEVIKKIIDDILLSEKAFVSDKLYEAGGYFSLGDVLVYAQNGDQDATTLLDNYRNLDNSIWDFIGNILPTLTLSQLQSLTFKINPDWSFSYVTE